MLEVFVSFIVDILATHTNFENKIVPDGTL